MKTTYQTRIGDLSIEDGIPSKESIAKLYDEMDFQRATQDYIWAMPAVHFNEWAVQMKRQLGLGYGDVAIWDKFCDPRTIGLTPNDTTIYAALQGLRGCLCGVRDLGDDRLHPRAPTMPRSLH